MAKKLEDMTTKELLLTFDEKITKFIVDTSTFDETLLKENKKDKKVSL